MEEIRSNHWIDELLQALNSSPNFSEPRIINPSSSSSSTYIEGQIAIGEQSVDLVITLTQTFPLHLPVFRLKTADALGFIPHVDTYGIICFAEPEGILLDRNEPTLIVLESLERVLQLLNDGVTGKNKSDFVDEFEVYWGRRSEIDSVISFLQPGEEVQQVVFYYDQSNKPLYVANNQQEARAFFNQTNKPQQMTIQNGLYLPLEKGTLMKPPDPAGDFWTEEDIRRNIIPNLSEVNRTRLVKLLRGRNRRTKHLIIKLPRFTDGDNLFGIKYRQISDIHPLLDGGGANSVTPLQITRCDRQFLTQRGGSHGNIDNKHVLLVGCGAVGGNLAIELAKSGVTKLTLVDSDRLNPENTYRHVLGKKYWTDLKVEALKEELEQQLPYMQVDTLADRIEHLLLDEKINLNDYDLIVMATGDPTVELYVNQLIHDQNLKPVALFTWLEPLGIGGHALLTNNTVAYGCLQCLYTSPDGTRAELSNRAAFAAAGQFFGRAISGCGSLHTPFGSVDASQTSLLAARLAISMLSGEEPDNPLVSWKGDSQEFINQGFDLSDRYHIPESKLHRDRYLYKTTYCPVCGNNIED